MSDLSSLSSTADVIAIQSDSDLNLTRNSTSNLNNDGFTISYDTMRVLFLAIAIITVLICLTICTTVCICICLRRRLELKRNDHKNKLLPDQSGKPSGRRSSQKVSPSPTTTNGKPSSSVQPVTSNATHSAAKSFYYDNLDDIPFIDESRPTSVIDITQV